MKFDLDGKNVYIIIDVIITNNYYGQLVNEVSSVRSIEKSTLLWIWTSSSLTNHQLVGSTVDVTSKQDLRWGFFASKSCECTDMYHRTAHTNCTRLPVQPVDLIVLRVLRLLIRRLPPPATSFSSSALGRHSREGRSLSG